MNKEQEEYLIEQAKSWLTRTHIKRTEGEKSAYLEALQDTLIAVYQDTSKGWYPAHHMYDVIEQLFEEG